VTPLGDRISSSALSFCCQGTLPGGKTFDPERSAFDHEFDRMVDEPVHGGGTHEGVRENAGPLTEVPV